MLLALLFASDRPGGNARPAPPDEFARSYIVFALFDEDGCVYFMTDVGVSARQLTEQLKGGYDPSAGLEILTNPKTPASCIRLARSAAARAGFRKVRARPETTADKPSPLP